LTGKMQPNSDKLFESVLQGFIRNAREMNDLRIIPISINYEKV